MATIQEIADKVAQLTQTELAGRGIQTCVSDIKGLKANSPQGWLNTGEVFVYTPGNLYQVMFSTPYQMNWEKMSLDEVVEKYGKSWAIDLGIKLARPHELTTYELECPQGPYQALIGRSSGLVLRIVTDYTIHFDIILARLDVLVRWNDE